MKKNSSQINDEKSGHLKMKKRNKKSGIALIILISFTMFGAIVPRALAWPYFAGEFGVNDATGVKETNVWVPVEIFNTDIDISCIIFGIHYNKNVLGFESVRLGELTSEWNPPVINDDFDWGALVRVCDESNVIFTGSTGSVVELNFKVIGEIGQMSDMKFYDLNNLPDGILPNGILHGIQLSGIDGNLGTAPPKNGIFTVVLPCEGDFDCDRDVDGSNLAALASNPGMLDLSTFAGDFGRTDCPPCPEAP